MLCTLAGFIIFYSSDDVLMYSYFPEILSYAICSTASVNPSGYFDSWLEINSSVETRKKYDGPFDGLTIYSSFIDKFAPFLLKSFFSFQLLTTVYSRFPRSLSIFFFFFYEWWKLFLRLEHISLFCSVPTNPWDLQFCASKIALQNNRFICRERDVGIGGTNWDITFLTELLTHFTNFRFH